MVDNWQKSVSSRALPEEAMTGWNEGMTRLQQLAERLNRLDEQQQKQAEMALNQLINRYQMEHTGNQERQP